MIPTLSGINFAEIAKEIKRHASESKNEEDLRIRVENLLRSKVFDKLGIPWASYEHKSKKLSTIKPGRKDALYGRVIIEYEPPEKFKSRSGFEEAKNQVKRYIEEEAERKEEYSKFFGIAIDGYSIGFVRFRKKKWEESAQPSDINEQTISTFLRAISGLQRKPIDVEYLLLDFGPRSELSKRVILNLYAILLKSKSERTRILFDDWRRVFSQVCSYSKDKLEGLIEYYGLQDHKIIDVEKLMFAIHSYYTLLMKLLTSEIVSFFNPIFGSFLERLETAFHKKIEELYKELEDLEEGGIIAKIGIRNFLEADYFAWYLDEWNKTTAELIIEVVRKLREYEPGTAELDPDRVKDLFKRLYQNLVPKKVRHDLGEYFTPDWLAEFLLNEVKYDGDPHKRILDPACGSGTFLVLTIKRIKDYAEQHFIGDKKELLKNITNNVVGIDLNPLAVLASRANYIIALGELIRVVPKEGIEIPVYLADSIVASRTISLFTGKPEFVLETSAGKFWVREELIKKNLWESLLNSIEFCLKNDYSTADFKTYVNKIFVDSGFVSKDAYGAAVRLYEQFLKLEKRNLDRIWTKVIKNSFAPLLIGQFDYVVGNPPWIRWTYLPDRYREITWNIWKNYGLFAQKGLAARVGTAEMDFSMLFVYSSIDRFLLKNGVIGFLITLEVFKTKGAGEGFRRFNLGNSKFFKIIKVHDMVDLKPFEGAVNKTAMFIAKKGEETKYPVPYTRWTRTKTLGSIPMKFSIEDVLRNTRQDNLLAEPIGGKLTSPWQISKSKVDTKLLNKLSGKSWYKARRGISSEPYGVYWIKIIDKVGDDIIIENLPEMGKRNIPKVKKVIEPHLVYPAVRGRDIEKWRSKVEIFVLIPNKGLKKESIPKESWMKSKLPKTYDYLLSFKKVLLTRGSNVARELAEREAFYAIYGVGEYTFAPFKVVWQRMGKDIKATVLGKFKADFLDEKIIIPLDTTSFIPCDKENEAYFICALLNSKWLNEFIKSFSSAGRGFAPPSILNFVSIPQFDPKNKIHEQLALLSKRAHTLIGKDKPDEFKKTEDKINILCANIWKIK